MTRDQAIEIRQKQLQGQAVSPKLVEEAMAVLHVVESTENDMPKPRLKKAGPRYAMRTYGLASRDLRFIDNKQVKLLKAALEVKT